MLKKLRDLVKSIRRGDDENPFIVYSIEQAMLLERPTARRGIGEQVLGRKSLLRELLAGRTEEEFIRSLKNAALTQYRETLESFPSPCVFGKIEPIISPGNVAEPKARRGKGTYSF